MQTSFFIRVSPQQKPYRNWNPFCISHLFLSTSESALRYSKPNTRKHWLSLQKFTVKRCYRFPLREGKIRGGTFNR
jgi:hypothetical protein